MFLLHGKAFAFGLVTVHPRFVAMSLYVLSIRQRISAASIPSDHKKIQTFSASL
jgi:hypothetical protein